MSWDSMLKCLIPHYVESKDMFVGAAFKQTRFLWLHFASTVGMPRCRRKKNDIVMDAYLCWLVRECQSHFLNQRNAKDTEYVGEKKKKH